MTAAPELRALAGDPAAARRAARGRDPFRQGPEWLRARRERAAERFAELGLPSRRDEAWRAVDLGPIARTRFRSADAGEPGRVAASELTLRDLRAARLVLVGGRFAPELSRLDAASGVELAPLARALERGAPGLERHLARGADFERHTFRALNTAFFTEGAYVRVPAGLRAPLPIHVVHAVPARGEPTVYHERCLIVLEEGAAATVIESFVGPDGTLYLTNAVTEVALAPGASLEHRLVQREGDRGLHLSTAHFALERDARLASRFASLGGATARTELDLVLAGQGAEADLAGLWAATARERREVRTRVDHAVPHGASRQEIRGIADDHARGAFTGEVLVRPGAQGTDARQAARALVLSEGAAADAAPLLEIHADDVRCAHGAAIGRLDEAALFYLRARGLDRAAARGLLVRAFAAEVLRGLDPAPLRERVERVLARRMGLAGDA